MAACKQAESAILMINVPHKMAGADAPPLAGRRPVPVGRFGRVLPVLWCVLLCAGWGWSAEISPENPADRTYVFKGKQASPPFEYLEDGRPTGLNVELLEAVARVMELDIRIELGPWAEVRREFEEGRIDGLTGFYITRERTETADFAVPISYGFYALFVRQDSPFTSLEDAWHASIIVQRGDLAKDYLQENGFPGVLLRTNSPADALRRLAGGYGDAALVNSTQGRYLCEQLGLRNLKPVNVEYIPCISAFAVTKGNQWLLGQLNEGLRIVTLTGEYGAIRHRYELSPDGKPGYVPWIFLSAFALVLTGLFLVSLWTYLLRREVRRRTDALRQSEARYRTIFENSNDALLLLADRVRDCNEGACALLALSREELIGLSPADFSPPVQADGRGSAEAARDRIDAALSGTPQLFNWVHRRKDGVLVDAEVVLCAIPGLGEPLCMAAIRDLSARKAAEEAFRREQDLVRVVTEISPVGVVTLDPAGNIIFANARAERILRLRRSEICERRYNDPQWRITDVDGGPFPDEALPFSRVLSSGKPVYDVRHAIEHPGGARALLSISGTPLLSEAGEMVGVVLTFDDITAQIEEEREKENRWRRIEQQQAAIIRVARDAAMAGGDFNTISKLIVTLATEVLGVNTSSLWLFSDDQTRLYCVAVSGPGAGAEPKLDDLKVADMPNYIEALESGRHVDAADAHHDPRTMQLLENYLIPHEVGALLDASIRMGGRLVGVLCNEYHDGVRYWRPDEIQFAAELADQAAQALAAQERRRAEEDRVVFEARMQQAQRLESLGILAGGLAHDFNNLLTAILGNVDLALMDVPSSNPAELSLKEIRSLSNRAADLCRSMLAYAGKGRFIMKPLDLNEEIRQMGHMLASSVAQGVRVVYRLEGHLPTVAADRSQMHQVLTNLVVNAAEAIGDREGVVTVKTALVECDAAFQRDAYFTDSLPEGRYVAIEVADTGVGMDADTIEKVFNPFFSTKFVGRGMGLPAVLGIVRGHRGGIRVFSEPGKGTVFTVLLPEGDAPSGAIVRSEARAEPRQHPARVLLVDALPTSKHVTSKILHRLGYATLHAPNLEEAAARMAKEEESVTCILIDQGLNQLLDEAQVQRLSLACPGAPLLLATDLEERDAALLCERFGFAGHLRKPLRVAALAAKLSAFPA